MSQGIGHAAYAAELLPVLDELATFGPAVLIGALLVEVEKARAAIAIERPKALEQSDRVLEAIRSYLRGQEGARDTYKAEAEKLGAQLGSFVDPGGDEEAIWQYEWACVNLSGAQDPEGAQYVAHDLISFKAMWLEGYSRADGRREQITCLQAVLEGERQKMRAGDDRDRISLLAD